MKVSALNMLQQAAMELDAADSDTHPYAGIYAYSLRELAHHLSILGDRPDLIGSFIEQYCLETESYNLPSDQEELVA